MKNHITTLIIAFLLVMTTSSFATNYSYIGSWSPSAPPTTLPSGDTIFINYGTLNTGNTLYTFSLGSAAIIEAGAQWNSTKIVNNSDLFWIKGTLYMFGNSSFVNNGTTIIETTGFLTTFGNGKVTNNGLFIVNGNLSLTGNGKLKNGGTIAGGGNITLAGNGSVNNSGTVNGCTGAGCISSNGTTPIGNGPGVPNVYICNGTYDVPDSLTANDLLMVQGTCNIRSNVTVGQVLLASSTDKLIIRSIPSTSGAPTPSLIVSNSGSLWGDISNEGKIEIRNKVSLVQTTDSNHPNYGSGSSKVYNNRGDVNELKYNIWSSPIQNADLVSNFSGRNPCDMYTFNASNQEWVYDLLAGTGIYSCNGNPVDFTGFQLTDEVANGVMKVGRGYFLPGKGSSGSNIRFNGTLNNGDIDVTVYSTSVTTPGAWVGNDWNLIGNPYPSNLRADLFWTDNNAVLTNGVYFWDAAINDYQVWNSSGGTNPSNQNITSTQGFYVLADDAVITNGNSGTVSFTNAMRTDGSAVFYKKESTNNHSIWVDFKTPSSKVNRVLVGYSNSTTDNFDKLYDAHKLVGNTDVRFASMINTEEFIIQGISVPKYGETKKVSLVVFTSETGNHTFTEYKRKNIPPGMDIYLEDNFTGILHDLTSGDYVVHLDENQTYDTRFELVFVNRSSKADDVNESKGNHVLSVMEDNNTSLFILLHGENGYMLSNPNGIKGDVVVVSVTGSIVWSINNTNATSIPINLDVTSSGIYFIQVIENNEMVYSNKIIK